MAMFQDNIFKRASWVKSNRYLPFPEKDRKNIIVHKGSLRIACSNAVNTSLFSKCHCVCNSCSGGVISRVQSVA